MRILVALTLPSEPRSVSLVRGTVAAALTSARVTRDCVAEVEVALTEACTNVLLHPGLHDGYEVTINIGDEQLVMDVLDPGSGSGDPAARSSMPTESAAEDGRGLALMRAFTEDALFDSVTGAGRSVHLVKRLRWNENRAS